MSRTFGVHGGLGMLNATNAQGYNATLANVTLVVAAIKDGLQQQEHILNKLHTDTT
jgi:hypothetical protein